MEGPFGNYFYKLVVIGDSGVGKSSLLSRVTYNEFKSESKSTIGVDFATKTFEIQGKAVKVQIWDTAGQERFRAISRVFYNNATAAMITYDVTNASSFYNVTKWLKEIEQNCRGDVTKMLVGNKIDLRHLIAISNEDAQEFARENDMLFTTTSALDSTNVEDAFYELILKAHNENIRRFQRERKKTEIVNIDINSNNFDIPKEEDNSKCCT